MTDLEELLAQEAETRDWLRRVASRPWQLPAVDEATELEQLRLLAEPFSTEDWATLLGEPPRPRHPTPDW